MKRLIFVFAMLLMMFLVLDVNEAFAEEGRHSLGIQGGQVGLFQDVGSTYGSALGAGAFFDYASSDWLELELAYLGSRHSLNGLSLNQSSYTASMIYNIDELDAFTPYLRLGAEYVSHTQDVWTNTLTGPPGISSTNNSGFGLDMGLGGKFMVGNNFSAGLDVIYHSVFDVSVTPLGSNSQKVIQSYYTVLFRLAYVFSASK